MDLGQVTGPSGGRRHEVEVHPDSDAVAAALARSIVQRARSAIASRGRFSVALAGGSTPAPLYRRLAEHHRADLPWSKIWWLWGDERLVPLADPRSNHRLAVSQLLGRVPVDWRRVFPVPTGRPASSAAAGYGRALREVLGAVGEEGAIGLDVVLLGLGTDGHTASIFPGTQASAPNGDDWAIATRATGDAEVERRVSLSPAAIRGARHIAFMVTGSAKRDTLARVMDPDDRADAALPAARIADRDGVSWWLDRAAAPETTPSA